RQGLEATRNLLRRRPFAGRPPPVGQAAPDAHPANCGGAPFGSAPNGDLFPAPATAPRWPPAGPAPPAPSAPTTPPPPPRPTPPSPADSSANQTGLERWQAGLQRHADPRPGDSWPGRPWPGN